MRQLLKVKVLWDGGNGWTFNLPKGKMIVYHGSIDGITKFLQKIQAKDVASEPKSDRNKTYKDIALEIQTGQDREIWVWDYIISKVPNVVYEKNMQVKSLSIELSEGFEINGFQIEKGDTIVLNDSIMKNQLARVQRIIFDICHKYNIPTKICGNIIYDFNKDIDFDKVMLYNVLYGVVDNNNIDDVVDEMWEVLMKFSESFNQGVKK